MIKITGGEGYYSIFGIDVKGFVLWAIWAVEAIGIVGVARLAGKSAIHEEVFCEACNQWVEEQDDVFRTEVPDQDVLAKAIAGDVDAVLNLSHHSTKGDEAAGSQVLRFNYKHCDSCNSLATLDWDLVGFKTNSKGEMEKDEEDISPVFILTDAQKALVEGRLTS